jgi:hypothetical protein
VVGIINDEAIEKQEKQGDGSPASDERQGGGSSVFPCVFHHVLLSPALFYSNFFA